MQPLKTILLVEDNPAHVLITEEAFQETKHETDDYEIEIISVRDGIEALKYLGNAKSIGINLPDLLIIDINLPLLNGLDLLKKVKSHNSFKMIPSIIITNGTRKGEIDEAYARQCNSFIIKPFKYDDFLEMIRLLKLFWFKYVIIPKNLQGENHDK